MAVYGVSRVGIAKFSIMHQEHRLFHGIITFFTFSRAERAKIVRQVVHDRKIIGSSREKHELPLLSQPMQHTLPPGPNRGRLLPDRLGGRLRR